MKRTLLATVLAVAFAFPAAAQIPVTDTASITSRAMEALRSLQEAQRAYAMLENQYRTLQNTYNALSHSTDLGGIAGALGGVGRTFLPPGSNITQGLSSIQAGAYGGVPGMLSGAQSFLRNNQAHDPNLSAREWQEQEGQRRAAITANGQQLIQQSLADTERRLANLERLKGSLENAKDVTEVAAVQGLIAIERANLEVHAGAMRDIQALMATDDRVERQRFEEQRIRSARELQDGTRPITGAWR